MNAAKHLRFLLILLYTALILGALYLLSPALLPFLLGWVLARTLEPAVDLLCTVLRLRRRWAAAAVLLTFLALFSAGGYFLIRRLWFELTALSAKFTLWMQLAQEWNQSLSNLIYRWTVAVSPELRSTLQTALSSAAGQITQLLSALGTALLERLANFIPALPRAALFLFTALLAGFFFLADRSVLNAFFQKHIPAPRLVQIKEAGRQIRSALGGWLKAQGILMAVTFALLTAGFLLMGVDAAILSAAGIAILDALPVFGTGTVLLPWSLLCVLKGNLTRGISLAALYALLWLTRSLLEPKLIANRAGLHPLAALLAMYLGFTLFGVTGLILAPLGAVLAARLFECSIAHLRQR